MLKYITKRVLRSFVTMFIIMTIVFLLLTHMPIEGYFENFEKMSQTQIKVGLDKLGLNDPLHIQLKNFYARMAQLDFGKSIKYRVGVNVTTILAEKAPVSIRMGLLSLTVSLALGLPMGVMMARSTKGKWKLWDKFGTVFIVLIQAVPAAVYYLFIQLYGSTMFKLPLLYSGKDPRTWILPVVSLALGNIAYYAMWLRRYMVDESNKDYVRLARAKGLSENRIMFGHVFRNAIVPLVQYLPNSILFTVMGSIYVESLYSVPGMGGLLVNVIQRQDNPMVQSLVLIYSMISIAGLLFGDILMASVDPRISFGKKEDAR